ncbi:MAG: response regulator [Bacteroidales bacterium]|nr:response regulator [Bacteroidales bacterium]
MNRPKMMIIDDEQDAITSIELITKMFCPEIEIVGNASLIDAAFELIKKTSPDFIILDVIMTRGSGYDLLERFPIRKFDVIFMSAYTINEVKAKAYGAFYNLQKPIDINLFITIVNKLTEHRRLNPGAVFRFDLKD